MRAGGGTRESGGGERGGRRKFPAFFPQSLILMLKVTVTPSPQPPREGSRWMELAVPRILDLYVGQIEDFHGPRYAYAVLRFTLTKPHSEPSEGDQSGYRGPESTSSARNIYALLPYLHEPSHQSNDPRLNHNHEITFGQPPLAAWT